MVNYAKSNHWFAGLSFVSAQKSELMRPISNQRTDKWRHLTWDSSLWNCNWGFQLAFPKFKFLHLTLVLVLSNFKNKSWVGEYFKSLPNHNTVSRFVIVLSDTKIKISLYIKLNIYRNKFLLSRNQVIVCSCSGVSSLKTAMRHTDWLKDLYFSFKNSFREIVWSSFSSP